MTSLDAPRDPSAGGRAPADTATGAPPDPTPGVATGADRRKLMASLLGGYLFLFATYAGVIAILLPYQVGLIDADAKVGNLAIVTSLSALATIVAQPIVGALSDRTRTRLGRRAPWMVFGGIGGGILTIALQFSTTIFWIAALWVLAQVLLNAFQAPMSAVIADRVDERHRATASAFTGVGTALGATIGIVVAGQLLTTLGVAYTLFGGLVIVAAVAFVLLNPDRTEVAPVTDTFRWGAFFRGFWVSPRKHPDFGWAFGGRFFMVLGTQGLANYQFYVLTDYIHLDPISAGGIAGTLSLCSVVTTVIGTLVFGRLSDLMRRRKIFVFGASIVVVIGVMIPVFSPTVTGMILMSLVMGIGSGAYTAVDFALMVDVLPSRGDAGKDLGVLNIASNVPQALVGSVAVALLAMSAGNYAIIFFFAAISVIISSLLVLPIKSVR